MAENVLDYLTLYQNCKLCPRKCGVNRVRSNRGYCGSSSELYVARAALHMWEEPCISGKNGSGAVFFSGCPMHCVFCQNHEISDGISGKKITVERLSEIFLELQDKGANNINLVTPSHYLPHILEASGLATENGLSIPFVYNCSGYESVESLEMLRGIVKVFLPDFKYYSTETASLFSKAPDYTEVAKAAVDKMVDIAGSPVFDENGIIQSGVIVRVLVLPLHTNEAINIIKYLHETYGEKIYISIMSQYTPIHNVLPKGKAYECLDRTLTSREYEKVVNECINLNIKNAFIQEGAVNLESFIPPFDNEGV